MLGLCQREVVPGTMIRIIATAAAVLAIVGVFAVASGRSLTSAQTDPTVSVDAISDSSNTDTTVGPIDNYVSTTVGATLIVDVVIEDVTNISGFQANLLYDFTKLKVTAVDYSFLLASTGAIVLDFGNTTPDTDGDFFMAAAMYSPVIVIGADGEGVLARISFEALASGSSLLDLTNVKLSDADGNPIPPVDTNNFYVGPINDAEVAIEGIAVGGAAHFPDIEEPAPVTTEPSSNSSFAGAALAGSLAAVVVALAAGSWYAKRRWLS